MKLDDHSRIPLQPLFLLKIITARILYVKLYGKSLDVAGLEVHLLVVEQGVDPSGLIPYISDWSRLKHMSKNSEKLNIFMN